MSERYIVVVEIDNKRALAAYEKALSELEHIWPQMLARARENDNARRVKLKEEFRLEDERYQIALAEYERKKVAHSEWMTKGKFIRGPEPEYSSYSYPIRSYASLLLDTQCMLPAAHYFMLELKRKRDIASAAISPYRVMESEALEMVAWENGEGVERAKMKYLP